MYDWASLCEYLFLRTFIFEYSLHTKYIPLYFCCLFYGGDVYRKLSDTIFLFFSFFFLQIPGWARSLPLVEALIVLVAVVRKCLERKPFCLLSKGARTLLCCYRSNQPPTPTYQSNRRVTPIMVLMDDRMDGWRRMLLSLLSTASWPPSSLGTRDSENGSP